MFRLSTLNKELIAAKPYAKAISPGPGKLFVGRAALAFKVYSYTRKGATVIIHKSRGKSSAQILGEALGERWTGRFVKRTRIASVVLSGHLKVAQASTKDVFRKNGMGGRSWINHPGRYKMVIVFHDANKAGPHIDVHLDKLSVVYRVKPELYAQLRYNTDGYLTQDSQKLLLDHVRSEIAGSSRVPQNLDHSLKNARVSWVKGGTDGTDYGSGPTRQVISETEVDVYKTGEGHPIEMYAPLLNPHRPLYLYELYHGDDTNRAPILIWGAKKADPPRFDDRLHLKLVHPQTLDDETYPASMDFSTSTAKYDGSSAYIVITNKGTTVWSPRKSVETGEQIEYTMKLNGVASVSNDETIVAMGEVLFRTNNSKNLFGLRGGRSKYLPCAEGSGILNSNIVLPANVTPEIRLYRVDRIGRERTGDLGFWENRELQNKVAQLDPKHFKVVELMDPTTAKTEGFEGVVMAPYKITKGLDLDQAVDMVEADPTESTYLEMSTLDGRSLDVFNFESIDFMAYMDPDDPRFTDAKYEVITSGSVKDGYKVKWWTDPQDWRIDQVAFEPGPNGGVAGVLHCTSLESGKAFKLGPGQTGDRALCEEMMAFPERYVGSVVKVNSRHGHEGRAAKVIGFHDDKGSASF